MTTSPHPHSPRSTRVRTILGATAAAGIAAAGTVLLAPAASAHPVEVNFDGGTPNTPCSFSQVTAVHNQYAGIGVKLRGPNSTDGGAILDKCAGFGVDPHSGLRFLAFNDAASMADGGVPTGPEKIIFKHKEHHVSLWVSQGGTSGDTATFTLTAKRHGHRVDRDSVTTNTADWAKLAVHAHKGIKRVVLTAVDPDGAYVVDDLTFSR
jgi:hypothetical protein